MKLTSINGRVDHIGTHNDRKFNVELADHICAEKTKDNKTWNYLENDEISFREAELLYYEQNFTDHLEEINKRYIKNAQPQHIKTIEQYYESKRTQPEDRIIQIGDAHKSIDPDTLWEIGMEYKDLFNRMYSPSCRIITMALHNDEATPHIHIRRVWLSFDKSGNRYVNQKGALRDLGFSNCHNSRFENAKIDFSKEDRDMLYQISRDRCKDIEIVSPQKKEHLNVRDYRLQENMERERRIEANLAEIKEVKKQIDINNTILEENLSKIEYHLSNIIEFYDNSGFFADEEEREELAKKPIYDMISTMHELFMERVSALGEREIDPCL